MVATSQVEDVQSKYEETALEVLVSLHVHNMWGNNHAGTTLSDGYIEVRVYLPEEEAGSLKRRLHTHFLLTILL